MLSSFSCSHVIMARFKCVIKDNCNRSVGKFKVDENTLINCSWGFVVFSKFYPIRLVHLIFSFSQEKDHDKEVQAIKVIVLQQDITVENTDFII